MPPPSPQDIHAKTTKPTEDMTCTAKEIFNDQGLFVLSKLEPFVKAWWRMPAPSLAVGLCCGMYVCRLLDQNGIKGTLRVLSEALNGMALVGYALIIPNIPHGRYPTRAWMP